MSKKTDNLKQYWKKNVSLIAILLFIWALVSFGFGILFADILSKVPFFGVNLSFWFAQQGSIFTFVILLLIYAIRSDQLDKKYNVEEIKVQDNKEE